VDGLLSMPEFADIRLVFDTTNPGAHQSNWARLADTGVRMLDLTASAIGPCCVPAVNLDAQLDAPNLSMATCSAQAAAPIVAAVRRHGVVRYAEVVSAIASQALGPAERVTLDEFAELTTTAVQELGGARRAKTLTIVNPADPPMPMRTTVFCLVDQADEVARIEADVLAVVDGVQALLPGYRLKHRVQLERLGSGNTLYIPGTGEFGGTRITVLLEITAAGGYLPACAGNVAIVTSAAKATAEAIVERHAQTLKAKI
ncbi:acetylating acetaldehyde dehydrogenase, partial [Mycobacterium ulcerans]